MDTPTDYLAPHWDAAGRMHDWRNYISTEVREIWETFTGEQRAAMARQADSIASNEEWD